MAEEELLAASPAALASDAVALGAEAQEKEAAAEEAAAVKIQAAERGRALRERKRAELKAKAEKQRRRINEQLDEQEAQLQNAVLKQEHDADAQRHAEELEQSSVRKQQLLNERLAEKRRQLEEETYCLGLCTRQTELGRANAAKRRATAVRQMADEESQREQEQRAKDLLTTASKWNAEEAATAAARSRLGRAASAVKLPAGAWSIEVDREQRKREPILKLSHFLESAVNVPDGVHPQRNKAAWVKLKPGCSVDGRAGKWIECYPFAVTDGGLSCQVFESVLYASDTGINASTFKLEDVVEFQKELPDELHPTSATDTGKDKHNVGATAKKLRTGLINFLTTGDDVAGQKRTVHRRNLLLFSVYFASLCAMTVLVMLVPRMLALAWLVVIGLGAAGYIGCGFNTIWLLQWLYTTLLLLVPGSIMGNTDPTSYWPNAAGYLFVGVLWCSGWIFMWVQGKGDQHALACVRTVMWDDRNNAPVAAVTRAFHIQMTKPWNWKKAHKKQSKEAVDAASRAATRAADVDGNNDATAAASSTDVATGTNARDVDGQGDTAADQADGLGDTTADEGRKSKKKELLVATMCSDELESWNDLSITSVDRRIALWRLQASHPELRTERLRLLKFHKEDTIVLKTGPNKAGWCTGYLKRDETTYDQLSLMERMPSGLTMQLKLWTAAYEGFAYCSFSFFPAMPWENVGVPPGVPPPLHPQNIFLSGIFELQTSSFVQLLIFVGAFMFVPLAFLLLYLVRNNVGKTNLVIEVAFAALTFPVMKRFTDVFACTSGTALVKDKQLMSFKRLCETPAPLFEDCMDVHPDVPCWSQRHHLYILAVMCMLVPYYIGSLIVRSNSQAKSSAVIIDGIYAIVAFQLKFVLAVLASGWGDCHPIVLIAGVESAVIIMAAMSTEPTFFRRRFSNVLELNAVRATGLMAAAFNGFYAVYITARYGEETCNPPDINRTTWDFGQMNKTHFDGAEGPKVKATLAEFIVLLGINVGALAIGYGSYSHKKKQLTAAKNDLGEDPLTVAENVHQVDYQLVNWRLQVEKKDVFDLFLAEFRDEEEATVHWDDKTKSRLGNRASGQQIEEVTLDKVLFTEHEVNAQRKKDFKKIPIRRIHVKDFDIRTEGGHRLSSKLKAIVESRHPTGMIPTARQSCKSSINRCTCCELHCCRKGSSVVSCQHVRTQGDACAVSCCGKERRCKRACGPPGFAPYKMSVSLRRLRGALYGHESDSSDDDDDEDKAPLGRLRAPTVSPSNKQSMRQLGRSRAQTVSSHVSALAKKGMSALPESAVTAASGLASQTTALAKKGVGLASQTTAIAKKQLIAVPFLPFSYSDGKILTNAPAYVQLLQLLVQTPDLTSLDLRGCDYPLEYFLQDKIVDGIPEDKSGQLMTDLEEITIDFSISATDTQSYLTIKRFDKAKHVVQRIREAAVADDSVIHSVLNLKPSSSGEHDAASAKGGKSINSRSFKNWHKTMHGGSKPVELYPDHLYILMGYLKKMGRFDCDTEKSAQSSAVTPDEKPRKKSRSKPQKRFMWAPKLETLDISDNTHLIAESNRKGIEKRIMHRLNFELRLRQNAKPHRESFQNDLQREKQTEDKATKTSEEMTEMRHAEHRHQYTMEIWTKMCECLRKNTDFRTLRFRNIGLGPTTMETTVRELLHPKDHPEFGQRLKELDISKNPLGTVGKAVLAEAFRSGDGLESLNVVTISLGDDSEKKYHLKCTVRACEGLVDRDIGERSVIGGANDVYVSLVPKGQRAEHTSVITEGGTSPTWNEQHTREFTWSLDHCTTLEVSVWDKDILSADDLLGGTTITEQSVKESTAEPRWFELRRGGKDAGRIQLELRWKQSKCTPQTLKRTNSSLDLSGRSLSSEDTAFLSGWLHHCRATIQEILINNNPNFVGETGHLPGDVGESEEMLTRVRHFELFCSALEETAISSLRFSDIGMGSESAKRLLRLLSSPFGAKLKALDLTANDLGKHGKQTVCKIIAKAQNLETLLIDLGRGHSTDTKAELTCPMKAGAATCELDFAAKHWRLKPDDVEVLAAWIKHCKQHIVSINLSNNVELANETAIKSLAADKTVVAQRCEHDPWSALCTALSHTEALNSLKLQDIRAGVSCAHILAYAMKLESDGKEPLARILTELDISGNPLALDGKAILVGPTGALQGSNIQRLSVDLGRGRKTLNRISPILELVDHGLVVEDSVTIAGWILHCSRIITTLDLSNNPGLIDYRCASWEQLCTALTSLSITDLGLAQVNLGADASTLLASALESPESKLRGSLIKLDISRNPLRMGKRAIFAALPGTVVKTLKVQIGCHDEVLLDATNSDAIELCETKLQPEDAALLAGWTSHIKDTLKQVNLADNPDFIGPGDLTETFASLMTAMADVPLERLRLPNTGMCLASCELLADAITQQDCKITSTLKTLDLGRNLQLVSGHSNAHTGTLSTGQDKRAQDRKLIPKRTSAKQKSEKSAADVAETAAREWHQLCQAVKVSAITQLELHACRLEPMHAVQVADILSNKTLKRLNLSGNPNLFGLGNDHSGWEALCAAMSNKKCRLDDLVISGLGMQYKGVDLIREHLPPTITSLDLSDNTIGERAVVRVKTNKKGEPRRQLNPEYGGKSGHTSYGKIKTGVVCIDRESGRPYKVSTYNVGVSFGDSSACILTDLETDKEGIGWSVVDLLQKTDAYEKTDTEIGSFSHIEKLWSQLAKSCKHLTSVNLSRCAIDAVSVRHFADSVRDLQALKTITIEATGHGPWRGLRGRHFDDREKGEDYTYTLFPAETIDLAGCALGPEDLELVAKWLQLPAVSPLLRDLRLSRNDRLLGNAQVEDGAMDTPRSNASGLSGQYRIMQRCVVRTEISNESAEICHLESGDLVEVTRLEAALVDTPTKKSPHKQVEQIVHRTRMFCPKQGGWISDRTKDNGLLAQRVRDHRGWKALCSALEEIVSNNDRSVAVEVSDVPLGPTGTAMADTVRGVYFVY